MTSFLTPSDSGPPPDQPDEPRLGIAHFLIWTAGSAVILAVQRAFGSWSELPREYQAFYLALSLPQAMVYGAVLGSLAVGVTRLGRGRLPFPIHPGQWLAMLWGVSAIGEWLAFATFQWRDEGQLLLGGAHNLAIYVGAVAALNLLLGAGCVVAVVRGRFAARWTVALLAIMLQEVCAAAPGFAFAVLTLRDFSSLLLTLLTAENTVHMAGGIVAALLILVAATGDARRHVRRDWMHWVGVAAVLWQGVAAWLFEAWSWFTTSIGH